MFTRRQNFDDDAIQDPSVDALTLGEINVHVALFRALFPVSDNREPQNDAIRDATRLSNDDSFVSRAFSRSAHQKTRRSRITDLYTKHNADCERRYLSIIFCPGQPLLSLYSRYSTSPLPLQQI